MSRERHLLNRIQNQSDKIKELEADWLDEHTKGVLKTKEIERLKKSVSKLITSSNMQIDKLNNIIHFFDVKLKDNEEYQKLRADLIGGKEEQGC
jgi:hypothetical protein